MTRTKHDSGMTILEAVETLASIAELDPVKEREIRNDLLIEGQKIGDRRVDWLATGSDGKETLDLVKTTFDTVLSYLKEKWRDVSPELMDPTQLEGIKTIMLLVGEAAKRLNHFNNLFSTYGGSPFNMEEYRQLQDFYMKKIDPKVSEETLGKWILGIGRLPFPKLIPEVEKVVQVNPQHLFVDMDAVRQDSEYELFFIRKEGGDRFFNPRLIRSMKLVSEFGFKPSDLIEPIPYIEVNEWLDAAAHSGAKSLLKRLGVTLDFFYMDRSKFKERELVKTMSHMFLSLMLASHSRYLFVNRGPKCCLDFFLDFLSFYREAIRSYDYQKLISYPPSEQNRLGKILIKLMQTVGKHLYTEFTGVMESKGLVRKLISRGYQLDDNLDESKLTGSVAEDLWMDHTAFSTALKTYCNSALAKVLDDLENSPFAGFDPWMQKNLPNRLGTIELGQKRYGMIRMPTPTYQESISKPKLIGEFTTFVESLDEGEKLLLFNFQNRTSWKEHARSALLEGMDENEVFHHHSEVITFGVDTDFYEQSAPYNRENGAEAFKESLREQLSSKMGGYYFAEDVEDKLFPLFVDEVIEEVHALFFEGKNILTQRERRSFIDLVHLFIQWKLIDVIDPSEVAFCCKDGVDRSPFEYALMWYCHIAFNGRPFGQREREQLNALLLAPPLMIRERDLQSEHLDRLLQTIKIIEEAVHHRGDKAFVTALRKAFGRMFRASIFEGLVRD